MAYISYFNVGEEKLNLKDATARKSIENLTKDVNELKTGAIKDTDKWIVISDSYGSIYPYEESAGTKTFFEYMREISGRTTENLISQCYSGCGFINTAGGGTFLQKFTAFSNSFANKGEITKIVVAAGRNDYISDYNTVFDAMKSFYTYCKQNYPNAEIMYGFIANGDGVNNGTLDQLEMVYNAYKNSIEYGATYLHGTEAILKNKECLENDGCHPTLTGKKMIAKYLYEAIVNKKCNVNYPYKKVRLTCSNDNIEAVNCEFDEEVINNLLHVSYSYIGQIAFKTPPVIQPNNVYTYDITTINEGYLLNGKNLNVVDKLLVLDDNDAILPHVVARYVVNGNKLQLQVYAYKTLSTIKTFVHFGSNALTLQPFRY